MLRSYGIFGHSSGTDISGNGSGKYIIGNCSQPASMKLAAESVPGVAARPALDVVVAAGNESQSKAQDLGQEPLEDSRSSTSYGNGSLVNSCRHHQ